MMKDKIIKVQTKIIRTLLGITLTLTFIMIGMMFNHIAVSTNGGRMPVLLDGDYYSFETEEHFSYHDSDEINNAFFSDKFSAPFVKFSIGDAFMGVFMAIMLVLDVVLIKRVVYMDKLVKGYRI